jgi:hypothetical protein
MECLSNKKLTNQICINKACIVISGKGETNVICWEGGHDTSRLQAIPTFSMGVFLLSEHAKKIISLISNSEWECSYCQKEHSVLSSVLIQVQLFLQ